MPDELVVSTNGKEKKLTPDQVKEELQKIKERIARNLKLPEGYEVLDIEYAENLPIAQMGENKPVRLPKAHMIKVLNPKGEEFSFVVGGKIEGNLAAIAEIDEFNKVNLSNEMVEKLESGQLEDIHLSLDEENNIEEMPEIELQQTNAVELIKQQAGQDWEDVAGVMKITDKENGAQALGFDLPEGREVYAIDYKGARSSEVYFIEDGQAVKTQINTKAAKTLDEIFARYNKMSSGEFSLEAGDIATGSSSKNLGYDDYISFTANNKFQDKEDAICKERDNRSYDVTLDRDGSKASIQADVAYPTKELHMAGREHEVQPEEDLSRLNELLREIADIDAEIESLGNEIKSELQETDGRASDTTFAKQEEIRQLTGERENLVSTCAAEYGDLIPELEIEEVEYDDEYDGQRVPWPTDE